MSHHQITLQPAYSCPNFITSEWFKLSEKLSLFWHQAETVKAVLNPEIDVIFNYGVPGSGKSLAAYLDALQGGVCTLGLYPTEELVKQQENQIQNYLIQFQLDTKVRVNSLSRKDLEIYTETQDISVLESRITNSEILLISPDILDYWYQTQYCLSETNLNQLWNRLEARFNLFVIDEFYQFNPAQITNIINMMFLLHYTTRPQKFLYISTTPNPKLIERAKVLGWRAKVVNSIAENKYQFPQTKSEFQQLEQQKWRQVSQKINLNFVSLESTTDASETWLRTNSNFIVSQFVHHPGSKGAIILNSIATVKRLLPFFRELLETLGLKVTENDDLFTKSSADLVLGTNTIGLGEDNPINFLIFESANVGQFIQRLGQLGRKDNYKDNNNSVSFEQFNAYALVPNFFVEHLFEGDSPILKSNTSYEPASFPTLIRAAYRQVSDWHGYYSRWGAIQSMQFYQQLGSPNIRQKYPKAQNSFQIACEEMFKFSIQETLNNYQEWQQVLGKDSDNLDFKNLLSCSNTINFLPCALYDYEQSNENARFKIYDLPEILINLEVEPISEVEFMKLLQNNLISSKNYLPKDKFKQCLAWMKLRNYSEEQWDWRFTYPGNLKEISESKQVQILDTVQVYKPSENDWINKLNLRLKQRNLLGYVLHCPITEVRQKFRLPMHFQIYPISQQTNISDTLAPYSVAFGKSALLLNTFVD